MLGLKLYKLKSHPTGRGDVGGKEVGGLCSVIGNHSLRYIYRPPPPHIGLVS